MTSRTITLAVLGFLVGLGWGCAEEPEDVWDVEMVGCIHHDEPYNPWMTCSEFCEWAGAECLEDGCEGATARRGHCVVQYSEPLDIGCDDPLVGDAPFKCCCDFR
jgi:hypothetical protein